MERTLKFSIVVFLFKLLGFAAAVEDNPRWQRTVEGSFRDGRWSAAGIERQTWGLSSFVGIERFSKHCRETNAKVVTPANHNRRKRRDESS